MLRRVLVGDNERVLRIRKKRWGKLPVRWKRSVVGAMNALLLDRTVTLRAE